MSDRPADETRGSGFDALHRLLGDRVIVARLRLATVADVLHAFQDVLHEFDVGGVLVAGFDTPSTWRADRDRYRRLAEHPERTVAVFCSHPLEAPGEVRSFQLPEDHPFTGHCFLLALTPLVGATLITRELPGDDPRDIGDEAPFEVIWSFDPSAAAETGSMLVEVSRRDAPDFADFVSAAVASAPPQPLDHALGQRYGVAILERLETSRRRWRDLSVELMDARRQLEDRADRQVKLERLASIGTLAASVAHELNNPLASITMAASLMGQLDDVDERLRVSRIIEAEALRAGRIASDLLSYVADRELELLPTRLDEWLADMAATYQSTGKPVTLREAPATQVDVDRDRLRQVVNNLVDNALDAITPDGKVELDLHVTGDRIAIGVTDDGVGIPERIRSGLFDPFVTSKPRGQGTGLGLPIARAHLQDHGGDIELVHTGPEGTRFQILLPRIGADQDDAVSPAHSPDSSVRNSATGGRVLVVDDEPPIRSLLETLLRRGGWQVVSAGGLREALDAVRSAPFDIALIDVQLGIDDGPKVLAELERVQPGLRDRTAYVTGAPPEGGLLEGRPVLSKPFSWDALAALLDRLDER